MLSDLAGAWSILLSSSLIYDHYQGGHLCTSSLCVTAKQSRRQKISPIKIVPDAEGHASGTEKRAHSQQISEGQSHPYLYKPLPAHAPDGGDPCRRVLCRGDPYRRRASLQLADGAESSDLDGSPIALVSHHPFLQSYLLSSCSAAVKFDLAGIASSITTSAGGRGNSSASYTVAETDEERVTGD